MTTVKINHKPTTTVAYTGLDGGVPIDVKRTVDVVVAHVGEPTLDTFYNNEFVEVKFVEMGNSNVIRNSLFAGHLNRLPMLKEGKVVTITYIVGTGWIESINGERWN